jgi:hypothetical protein
MFFWSSSPCSLLPPIAPWSLFFAPFVYRPRARPSTLLSHLLPVICCLLPALLSCSLLLSPPPYYSLLSFLLSVFIPLLLSMAPSPCSHYLPSSSIPSFPSVLILTSALPASNLCFPLPFFPAHFFQPFSPHTTLLPSMYLLNITISHSRSRIVFFPFPTVLILCYAFAPCGLPPFLSASLQSRRSLLHSSFMYC